MGPQAVPRAGRRQGRFQNTSAASLDFVDFDADSVESAIVTIAARGAQGLIYPADGVAIARREEIAESAIRHKLSTIFALRQNVDAGGLMSYSARISDLSRRAAFFVDRIFTADPAQRRAPAAGLALVARLICIV